MNLGSRLLKIAALYLLLGVFVGIFMGLSKDFSLMSVHAHLSLLGWGTLGVAGMVYVAIPACARSRLAAPHFWAHNAGLPVMMAALSLHAYGVQQAEAAIAAGSMVVAVAVLLFVLNVLANAGGGPREAQSPDTRLGPERR